MSRYAHLVCKECGVMIWLGKVVLDPEGRTSFFHMGDISEPRNWQRPELNRAIWKMLATCGSHPLTVITDSDPEHTDLDRYVEIGGDRTTDISFDAYLNGWPG